MFNVKNQPCTPGAALAAPFPGRTRGDAAPLGDRWTVTFVKNVPRHREVTAGSGASSLLQCRGTGPIVLRFTLRVKWVHNLLSLSLVARPE